MGIQRSIMKLDPLHASADRNDDDGSYDIAGFCHVDAIPGTAEYPMYLKMRALKYLRADQLSIVDLCLGTSNAPGQFWNGCTTYYYSSSWSLTIYAYSFRCPSVWIGKTGQILTLFYKYGHGNDKRGSIGSQYLRCLHDICFERRAVRRLLRSMCGGSKLHNMKEGSINHGVD